MLRIIDHNLILIRIRQQHLQHNIPFPAKKMILSFSDDSISHSSHRSWPKLRAGANSDLPNFPIEIFSETKFFQKVRFKSAPKTFLPSRFRNESGERTTEQLNHHFSRPTRHWIIIFLPLSIFLQKKRHKNLRVRSFVWSVFGGHKKIEFTVEKGKTTKTTKKKQPQGRLQDFPLLPSDKEENQKHFYQNSLPLKIKMKKKTERIKPVMNLKIREAYERLAHAQTTRRSEKKFAVDRS